VSMNIVDVDAMPLHVVVAQVRAEASLRGVDVVGAELVGLMPGSVVAAAAAQALALPSLGSDRVLELRLLERMDGGS
jgi:glutamate formiminotransferase / 5-formyltetrahydrofolate cyclo-ligase